jgi:hypothetical protein
MVTVDLYRRAQTLLREASDIMETAGETLIVAHIATPLALLDDQVPSHSGTACQELPD